MMERFDNEEVHRGTASCKFARINKKQKGEDDMKDYTHLTPMQRTLLLSIKRRAPEPIREQWDWTKVAVAIIYFSAVGYIFAHIAAWAWRLWT